MWVGRGVDTKQFNLLVGSFIFWVRCDFPRALMSLSLLTPVVFWVCRHQRLERGQERLRQQGTRERRAGPAPVLRRAADHRLQHVLKKNKCVCYVLRVSCGHVRSQQCNKQVCLYLPCCSLYVCVCVIICASVGTCRARRRGNRTSSTRTTRTRRRSPCPRSQTRARNWRRSRRRRCTCAAAGSSGGAAGAAAGGGARVRR